MTGYMPVIFFPGITHWSKLFFLSNDQVLYFNSFSHCFFTAVDLRIVLDTVSSSGDKIVTLDPSRGNHLAF
jgi:hypothetical protein